MKFCFVRGRGWGRVKQKKNRQEKKLAEILMMKSVGVRSAAVTISGTNSETVAAF